VNLYSALSCSRLHLESAQIWLVSNKITQFHLPPTHEPYLLLYSPSEKRHRPLTGTHCAYPKKMARLSWPGWLVTYRDKCPASRIGPDMHGHPFHY